LTVKSALTAKDRGRDRWASDRRLPLRDRGIREGAYQDEAQPSSPLARKEASEPKSRPRNDREIETGYDQKVVKAAGLKFSFDLRGKAKLAPEDHSKNHSLDRGFICEGPFQSGCDPFLDSVRAVPSRSEDRDQAGISDGPCPINALSFQVTTVIKHARIALDGGSTQFDDDLDPIAGTEV